jgi:predicted acyl esterase
MWPPGMTERPHHEFHDELLRWFDYHLKGIDTGIMDEPPIKMFVMGAERWRYEHEWPLSRTKWTELYLHPGALMPEPATCEYEPDGFTQPSLSVTATIHSVAYQTPPFTEPTEVTGPIALYLYAAIDSDDTNFIVDLMEVAPSGKETIISKGYLKASHRAVDETRSKPYQPYHPYTNPEPVSPGEIVRYAIELVPTSYLLKPGGCLKLVVRNQDNLMTPFGMWGNYHLPIHKTITHKIYCDKNHPSHLLLPVIPVTDKAQWLGGE